MKKSQFVGFLLTLAFGPFGLFYSSVPVALSLILLGLFVGLFTFGVGSFIVWPMSIFAGFFTVANWNKRLRRKLPRQVD